MEFTNVKDVTIRRESRGEIGVALHLWVEFHATYYGETRRFERYLSLKMDAPFQCCGLRTLSGMYLFRQADYFSSVEFLDKLVEQLNLHFRGGNVSFILNPDQKRRLEPALRQMDKYGRGLQMMQFRNFNMDNTNYLYIWTYKGQQRGRTTDPLFKD